VGTRVGDTMQKGGDRKWGENVREGRERGESRQTFPIKRGVKKRCGEH